MSATNPIRSQIGQWLLLDGAPPKPTMFWAALFLFYNLPLDSGLDGYEVATLSFGVPTGYARVAIPPGSARFAENPTIPGQFYNVTTIQFPTVELAWGAVTSCALMDSQTGGVALLRSHLAAPLNVMTGDPTPQFAPGALVFNVV